MAEDRALLARVARLNRSLGEVTVRLLGGLDPDEPIPPAVLRELAGHIDLLAVQLRARAESLATTVDADAEGAAGDAPAGTVPTTQPPGSL